MILIPQGLSRSVITQAVPGLYMVSLEPTHGQATCKFYIAEHILMNGRVYDLPVRKDKVRRALLHPGVDYKLFIESERYWSLIVAAELGSGVNHGLEVRVRVKGGHRAND